MSPKVASGHSRDPLVQCKGPQYTELFRMPQHSTMLRIISKIIMTATTMAAIPMRYSFPAKSSSIF